MAREKEPKFYDWQIYDWQRKSPPQYPLVPDLPRHLPDLTEWNRLLRVIRGNGFIAYSEDGFGSNRGVPFGEQTFWIHAERFHESGRRSYRNVGTLRYTYTKGQPVGLPPDLAWPVPPIA